MQLPRLPIELFSKIVRTSRFLERREALHDSRLWWNIRWYTGNGDITEVPEEWAVLSWIPELVRALCNPEVHAVHIDR